VARTPTTADVFNAVAEVRRREILHVLAHHGEQSVNAIARAIRVRQPQASKHLSVLKQVGVVKVRVDEKQRLYRLHAEALKPIFDWISPYEQIWNQRLDRLSGYLAELQNETLQLDE
jgi:DNA-binding transcriptional ArsR family regulator